MERRPAAQVGKTKCGLSVSAIGGTQEREERGVLRDGQKLTTAEGPTSRREVEPDDRDFGDVGI
jgi:hypothetical protein